MDLVDYDLDGPGIELNFKGIHIMGNPQSTIWGGMAGIPSIQILRDGFLHFFYHMNGKDLRKSHWNFWIIGIQLKVESMELTERLHSFWVDIFLLNIFQW